jgi:glucose-1-phosphate thymidylyltransferase
MKDTEKLKALILCAGKGTRLQPLTHTLPKPLIPVANKPILTRIIDKISELGIRHIGIVVSQENGVAIQDSIGDGSRWNVTITYILQAKAHGIAHAIMVSRGYLGKANFLLYLGDNLIQDSLQGMLDDFLRRRPEASILLKEIAEPQHFGVAELDAQGKVINIEEKPARPRSPYAIPGIYLFTPHLHAAIDRIRPSARGEMEITDSIQELINMGHTIHSQIHTGWWLDTGKKEDLLKANRLLLQNIQPQMKGILEGDTNVQGSLECGNDSILRASYIKGPVSIAAGCHIVNSRIGPHVSLGDGCRVQGCSIANSIILGGCRLSLVHSMKDSVLGRGVTIRGGHAGEQVAEFFLGDDSVVDLRGR